MLVVNESERTPLQETIDIMETMERIRKEIGLTFKEEVGSVDL